MVKVCPECGSTSLETVIEEAQTYCGDCGVVVERGAIVTEVTFTETNGQANVVGQFVSGETGKSSSNLPGFHRTSREQTVARATRRIRQMAAALKLKPHHIDAANRIYKLALQRNFTNGRKRDHVVAACLYVVIRRTGAPQMLLDLCDVLEEANVKTLGHTFLELCHTLNIQPPLVDPSLYIHLEFGDKEQVVAETALRFVQRMNRDWILTGRRPSGVCGAALMMAARVHGFKRTTEDIVPVVRIGDATLRKRIGEFAVTPSSMLTPAEFESMDLKSDSTAPPSFRKHRVQEELLIREALSKVEAASRSEPPSVEESAQEKRGMKRTRETGDEDDEKRAAPKTMRKKQKQLDHASSEEISESMSVSRLTVTAKKGDKTKGKGKEKEPEEPSEAGGRRRRGKAAENLIERIAEEEADALPTDAVSQEIREALESAEVDLRSLTANDLVAFHSKIARLAPSEVSQEESTGEPTPEELRRLVENALNVVKGAPQTGDTLIDPNLPEAPLPDEDAHQDENGLDTFSDIDDEEIDCYIYKAPEDKATKSKLWHHFNKDWLEEKAQKEQQLRDLLATGKTPRRSRKRMETATAGEAAQHVIEKKMTTKSSRINWEALQVRSLLDRLEESGIEGTPVNRTTDENYEENDDLMEEEEEDLYNDEDATAQSGSVRLSSMLSRAPAPTQTQTQTQPQTLEAADDVLDFL